MINTNIAINSINQNLAKFNKLANKITDPNTPADAKDIVAFKEAGTQAEVSVAVLKKLLDTQRAVDIFA